MSAGNAADGRDAARVAQAVASSRRYREVEPALVHRLAAEELGRARSEADAVKRVKRRLHQAVTAYRPAARDAHDLDRLAATWAGDLSAPDFGEACRTVLRRHASTRERLPVLENFFGPAWEAIGGAPATLADLGCGFGPLALPWMGLSPGARYLAVDVDGAQLSLVDGFLDLVGQQHEIRRADLAADPPPTLTAMPLDVALLLKLIPLLDRRDPDAARRLLAGLPVRHAVVSFPARSLGGRARGMERTYRERIGTLVSDLGERVTGVTEASVSGELVFVLALAPLEAVDG